MCIVTYIVYPSSNSGFSAVPGELKTVPLPALAQKRSKGTAMLRSSSVHPLAASAGELLKVMLVT